MRKRHRAIAHFTIVIDLSFIIAQIGAKVKHYADNVWKQRRNSRLGFRGRHPIQTTTFRAGQTAERLTILLPLAFDLALC